MRVCCSRQQAGRRQLHPRTRTFLATHARIPPFPGDYLRGYHCSDELTARQRMNNAFPAAARLARIQINLQMLAALATDPIAGLVDSIYMGHAGSTQLAAVRGPGIF